MKTTALVLTVGLACALPSAVAADAVDDDLAVVRNATASSPDEPQVRPEAPPPRSDDEPRWLRVHVVEHGRNGAKVKVNLPLSFLQAVGEDVPIPGCEGHEALTLGEMLRALGYID